MKGFKFYSKVFSLFAFFVVPLASSSLPKDFFADSIFEFNKIHNVGTNNTNEPFGVTTDPKQYIGYGYNVAAGKAIYEPDALMINNPILDVSNEGLMNRVKVFDGSKTEYQSNSSTKVSEITESYADAIAGGGGIGGGYGSFSVDVNAKFNKNATNSWSKISNEEYSYYTIFSGNRPVVLQLDRPFLSKYLTEDFKKDILGVNSEASAVDLFRKYGTHLLTGYTLGGIFEMTNYYATNSDSYVKEGTTSFGAQVGMALGSFAKGNGEFSFTNNYGYKDNNKYACNQYKCTTYGGVAFPGLTIDQAFSWYETITGAGYIYQMWTDSINAGKNLVIVNIPQSSKMVPLWDLIPNVSNGASTSKIKDCLINAYHNETSKAYKDFRNKNKDIYRTNVENSIPDNGAIDFKDKGFSYSVAPDSASFTEKNNLTTSTISSNAIPSSTSYKIKPNSYINIEYNNLEFAGEKVKWVVEDNKSSASKPSEIEVVDERNGVFKVGDLPENTDKIIKVKFYHNNRVIFERPFCLTSNAFSGGDGSELSPYLISNLDDLKELARGGKEHEYWSIDKHYKLTDDIDFIGRDGVANYIPQIGTMDVPFEGTFDGNYFTLKHFSGNGPKDGVTNKDDFALFGASTGTIKNLTLDYCRFKKAPINFTNNCKFISGLVAYTEQPSVIENCHVKNFHVSATVNDGTTIASISKYPTLYMGGLVGCGNGTIKNSSVDNCTFNATINKVVQRAYAGGIIGSTIDNNSYINKYDNVEISQYGGIIDSSSYTENDFESYNGGFGGYISNANLTNIIARDFQPYKERAMSNISFNRYGADSKSGHTVYLAGLIAATKLKINLSHVIVTATDKIESTQLNFINKEVDRIFSGIIIGRNFENSFDKKFSEFNDNIKVKDSYVDYFADNDNLIDNFTQNELKTSDGLNNCPYNITDVGQNFLYKNNGDLTKPEFGTEIVSNDQIWGFYENTKKPYMVFNGVNSDSLYLDTLNVKKVYTIGEEFDPSNLAVKGYDSNGEEVEFTNVSVNYSNYSKVRIGTYAIYVNLFGASFEYKVEVRDPKEYVNRVYVKQKVNPRVKKYFEGDNIVAEDFEFHQILNNGTDVVIKDKETSGTGEGFTCIVPNNKLTVGNNVVTFTYKDYVCTYNVEAYAHKVKELQIDSSAIKDEIYNVGTTEIDFSKVKVTAIVDKTDNALDNNFVVDPSDCVFLFSSIKEGQNEITVTYNVSARGTFVVNGANLVSKEKLDAFKLAAAEVSAPEFLNLSLKDRFMKLNAYYDLYVEVIYAKDLKDTPSLNYTQYKQSFTDFEAALALYDDTIDKINNGYEEAIKISASLTNSILVSSTGFITLAAILSFLFKKF